MEDADEAPAQSPEGRKEEAKAGDEKQDKSEEQKKADSAEDKKKQEGK